MRLGLAVLILALLPGCSAVKIAYNQADLVAGWMADDYFELTAEQKDTFRENFQRLHAWHRATQLTEYVALLELAQKRLNAGVKADDVAWTIDTIKLQYRAIVERGSADAARLLSTLSDSQIGAVRRQFEKSNRDYARDFGAGASADEQRRLRVKRNLERIEHWAGPLSAPQEARIAHLGRALPLVTDLRLDDRLRRQREFLALLERRKQTETFATRLREWLLDWDRSRSPEYEAALAVFVKASANMYVEVFSMLTPEQRNRVSDRLQRYATIFRDLAKEPPKTSVSDDRIESVELLSAATGCDRCGPADQGTS